MTPALGVVTDVVGRLYEAAAEPGQWPDVWKAVGSYLGATSGALYLDNQRGPPSFLAMPGWSDTALRLYHEHYNGVDPYAVFAKTNLSMSVKLGQSVISPYDYEHSEIWTDFARHHTGAFHLIGASIKVTDSLSAKLALHRPHDGRAFGSKERQALDMILKHIRSALALHIRLQDEKLLSISRASILESISSGIIVLDDKDTVIIHNAAGQHLGQSIGIRLTPSSRPANMDARLIELLRRVSSGHPGGKVLVSPHDDGPPIAVMVTPLPNNFSLRYDLGRHQTYSLKLILLRQLGFRQLPPDELINLFGLTVAEAEVTLALAAGSSPEEVAHTRGRSVYTLRAQIRAILEKTGTSGLRQLTSMVSALSQ